MKCPRCGEATTIDDGLRECTVCDWPAIELGELERPDVSILDATAIEGTEDDPESWHNFQTSEE